MRRDVAQHLALQNQAAGRLEWPGRPGWRLVAEGKLIPQEGGRGSPRPAEVIHHLPVHDHLRRQRHAAPDLAACRKQQVADLPGVRIGTANLPRRLIDRVVGEQREKPDGVEQVGLAGAIDAGNTGIGPEIQRELDQILEAVQFDTGQHDALPRQR